MVAYKYSLFYFLNFSIIDRLDGVRLLWSLLKSNNPKVCICFCVFLGQIRNTFTLLKANRDHQIGVRIRLHKPSAYALDCHISHQSRTDSLLSTGQQHRGVRALVT